MNYLETLNPEQQKAVKHSGSPLLILAGAGSGKTRVITTKIAYLIAKKSVDPRSILAVTFTNKAAAEMKERATRLDERASDSVIRTFHSFGAWLLRRNAKYIDLNSNFTIYDDDDAKTLLAKAAPHLSRDRITLASNKISRAKDLCLYPDSPKLGEFDSNPEFQELYRIYEKRLRETGNLDFGDLILLPIKLLKTNPEIQKRLHSRFQVIMVDEYQDSNTAQYELLKAITGENSYLCVVGDDDQSIYKFRGAEVENILSFHESFPGTKTIKLERNYRSFSPILNLATEIVSNNEGRLGKTLTSERGSGKKPKLVFLDNQDIETAYCAELIKNAYKKGQPYSNWAILYRTNAQSLGFETEFLHQKIPYKIVGSLKFYEREEIKDALAFLALILNGRDEISFRRVLNKPRRGIGAKSMESIIETSRRYFEGDASEVTIELNFDETKDYISLASSLNISLSKKARSSLIEFTNTIKDLRKDIVNLNDENNYKSLADFIEKVLTNTEILDYHKNQDEVTGTQRVANLEELVNSSSLYEASLEGLISFVEHIELDRSLASEDEIEDAVTLITLHNTKGLEFPKVIITGLESGIFPRDDKVGEDLEEERRLMYVGCTRAMDELYLTSCRMRRIFGKTNFMEPSIFLSEINSSSVEVKDNTMTSAANSFGGNYHGGYKQRSGGKPIGFGKPINSAKQPGKLDNKSGNDSILSKYPKWKKGATVFHDDYGYGIISKAFVSNEHFVVLVKFSTGGEKRFLPQYQGHSIFVVEDT